jgi:glycosyltransferase involved in cell wall biosynthesis
MQGQLLTRPVPPKLSVITPSFNQGAFLERTIRSVLDQNYPNLEYVIVDGGSSDDSVEIIRRYEDRLAWWVSEPDGGQTEAINKGIDRTTGEIVAYINSDDYYLPGAFETAIAALERSEASWVAGAAVDVSEEDPGRELRIWRPKPPSYCEGPWKGRHWWVLVPWHVPQPSSFWSRDLFDRFGLFRTDMHYAFDAEFMLRLALGGEPPELLEDKVLSTRSVHREQKTFDMTHSKPEIRRFRRIFRARMTGGERIKLRLMPAVLFFRNVIVYRTMKGLGDLLEYVPERIRPPIRHRDRGRSLPPEKSPVGIERLNEGEPETRR